MKEQKLSLAKLKKLNHNGFSLKNKPLKNLNTFKIGGVAKYYIEIHTLENFIKVMQYLNSCNVNFFIIGNGSNVLISDKGFDGVVVKFRGDFDRVTMLEDDLIEFGCGVSLSKAYIILKEHDLSGLECSVGIPASIGGATYMNASAYDFEMSKIVEYVVAYVDGRITYFTNEQCGFGYRTSIFQSNQAIILRVGLRLKTKERQEIDKVYLETLAKRKQTQPLNYPSAGCVFKRIDGLNISKMLDDAGFKGRTKGGARVSEKHANFIVNFKDATSQDVYELIKYVKIEFEKIYNIKLDCEIKFLGRFE